MHTYFKCKRVVTLSCIFICLLFTFSCKASNEPRVIVKTVNSKFPDIHEYTIPDTLTICGEELDLTDAGNLEMFDREFTIAVWDRPQVFMWLKRTGRFFPYFEERLEKEGLPDDLKYLAVAESSLHTHIKSKAGALGIWQLMEATAERYGLKVDRKIIDERLCFERSTDAALLFINDLKKKFDTWSLVMAAYNCGENKLNKAIKNQGTEDFFDLNLPRETERYVFRIAAIKLILENPEKFGYQIDTSRVYKFVQSTRVNVNIKDRFYISDLSELAGISYKDFMELNPQILTSLLPLGKYYLNVPPDCSEQLLSSISKLDDPAYREKHKYDSRYYIVQPGDVLSSISWETGVSVSSLKRLNRIRGSIIRPGQKLLIRR